MSYPSTPPQQAMIRRPKRNPMTVAAIATLLPYCFIVFSSCLLVRVHADASYSHTIPYGTEECLMIRIPKDQPHTISGSFDCLDTNINTDPVRVALYDDAEKVVWDARGAAEGSFSQRGTGKHWLCLENGLTHEQAADGDGRRPDPRQRVTRTIGFAVRVRKSAADAAGEGAGDADGDLDTTTRNLLRLTEELNKNFEVLTNHMSFMKAREGFHRELHEKTFSQVVKWNVLEICAVVVVTFGQVANVWWILSKRNNSYY